MSRLYEVMLGLSVCLKGCVALEKASSSCEVCSWCMGGNGQRRATLDNIEQEANKAWCSFGTILDMLRSYRQQVIWMPLPFGVVNLASLLHEAFRFQLGNPSLGAIFTQIVLVIFVAHESAEFSIFDSLAFGVVISIRAG